MIGDTIIQLRDEKDFVETELHGEWIEIVRENGDRCFQRTE